MSKKTKPLDFIELEWGTETHCPKSKGGRPHRPDWSNVTTEPDGGSFYIDVPCRYCGRSGCLGTSKALEKLVTW